MAELRPHPSVVFTPLDEREAILLHLETKRYYTLNETGRRIWELAAAGQAPAVIAASLSAEYEVTPEAAAIQTQRLIDELSCERLLVR